MSEILPIIVMYACAFLLVPFIAGAMYVAFDGDRRRARGELLGLVDPRVAQHGPAPDQTRPVVPTAASQPAAEPRAAARALAH